MADRPSSKFQQIPDALWKRIDLVLPVYKRSRKGGRPRLPMRKVVGGILYVLATGSQWKAMPEQFGSGSTIHAYFQEFAARHASLRRAKPIDPRLSSNYHPRQSWP